MGLLEFFAALSGANAGIKNNQKKNQKKKQQDDFDWETCCENCGELLEDCECDDQELSFEDIAMMDIIDEDDEEQEDFLSSQDDEEDDDLSFDDFESFDDEDDDYVSYLRWIYEI